MSDQGDLFATTTEPSRSSGGVDRNAQAPKPKRSSKKLWNEQSYELRARIIEDVAFGVDHYEAQDDEHKQFLREHAEHLRKLAQRMRDEKRPLA